jgi:hypothetical protein
MADDQTSMMWNFKQSTSDHAVLYSDWTLKDEIRPILRKLKKLRKWRLQVKIHISFCSDNSRTAATRHIIFGAIEVMHIRTSFIWTTIISDEAFKYGNGTKILRLGWDIHLTNVCIIMCFCSMSYLSTLFHFLSLCSSVSPLNDFWTK